MTRPGTLYGVGLGPGDPAYMTVRARDLVSTAEVAAFFRKRGRTGHARSIAAGHLPPAVIEEALEYPVTVEAAVESDEYVGPMQTFYAACAERLAAHLTVGRSVALLCEGDPFFYGSFMHMWRRLKDRFPVEVVPGVTGMSGCWTRAGTPMTWGDDVLVVAPATLTEDDLARRLAVADAAVVMKLGRDLAKVRRALRRAGLEGRAVYVERGTMAGETIMPLADRDDAPAPYFAMVIVPGEGRRL